MALGAEWLCQQKCTLLMPRCLAKHNSQEQLKHHLAGEWSLNKQSSLIFGEKLKGVFIGKEAGFTAVISLGQEMAIPALSTSCPVGGSWAWTLQAELL